jgi:hypothetical protein
LNGLPGKQGFSKAVTAVEIKAFKDVKITFGHTALASVIFSGLNMGIIPGFLFFSNTDPFLMVNDGLEC